MLRSFVRACRIRAARAARSGGAGLAGQAADQDRGAVFRRQRHRHHRPHRVRAGRQADRPDLRGREPRRRRHHARHGAGRQGRPRRLHHAGAFDVARRGGLDLSQPAVQRGGGFRGGQRARQHPVRDRDQDPVQDAQGPGRRRQEAGQPHPLRHRGRGQLRAICTWSASASRPDSRRRMCRSAARRKA